MSAEEKSIVDLAKEYQAEVESKKTVAPVKEEPTVATGGLNDILTTLLAKTKEKSAWIECKLPSLGKPYEGYYDKETVKLKAFGFEEERLIRSITGQGEAGSIFNMLFDHCVEGPPVDALTIPDKEFILFKLRQISYGDDYPIETTCVKCGRLNKDLTLKISNVPVTYLKEWKKEYTIVLPDSEVEVVYRIPRSKDDTESTDTVTSLFSFVKSVGGYEDSFIIKGFIKELIAKDIDILRDAVFKRTHGFDKLVFFVCSECGAENKTIVSLNENFFTAS